MALVPWRRRDLERPMASLQREMNRLFEDFFGRDLLAEPFRGMGEWRPAVDVSETDDAVVVKADLPGLDSKDVEVSLTGDLLTIKGEKKEEKTEKGKGYYREERSHGAFARSLRLPAAVVGEKVEASFKNGVLTVNLPKAEEAKRKMLKIDVS